MSSVLRISEAASLGMHAMVLLSSEPGRVCSTKEMAGRLGVSEAHLSKVMQRLARFGLAASVRGRRGGFRKPEGVDPTLLEVYEVIEGSLEQPSCLLGVPVCGGNGCILGGLMEEVGTQVREYLARTRVSALEGVYSGGDYVGKRDSQD